jgi:hypothetical protein
MSEIVVVATAVSVGSQGPPGPMGFLQSFEFDQATPATEWDIAHNLALFPSVVIVDTIGNVVEASIQYIDNNNVTVTFEEPFAGKAYLNGTSGYEFDQASPATPWNIAHGTGRFPSVTIVDSDGNQVDAAIQYIDSNNIQVSFDAAFSGKAYLN